jgi:uncharacterized protein YndB with AHSA1/START domain
MTDTRTLTFARSLNADPARVAAALTSAEARMAWGTPDADMVVLIEDQPEPAPGVREVSCCGPKENPYVTVRTDWVEITPTRISYAETLEAEGDAFATSLAIFELTPAGQGTDMAVTVFVASFAGEEALPEVEGGWHHAIDGLTGYLA